MTFHGFDKNSIQFLRGIKRNNKRDWFEKHRTVYEEHIVAPSRAFIESMRAPLGKISRHYLVSPKKSMFRIYRDVRFSADKSPYKTWIAYSFNDQRFSKDEAPGFYLGWDPTGLAYGGGLYGFSSIQRARFRERITEGHSAVQFTALVKKLRRTRGVELRGRELKRMPAGYDPAHPNAEFLLHTGLYAFREEDFTKAFFTPALTARAAKMFTAYQPLLEWLAEWLR